MIFLYVFLWFLMFQMNVLYVFYVFSCDFLCFMWHKNLWTSPKTTIFLHFPATFATFATLPSRPPPHLATPPAAATLRQRPRQGQAPRWMRSFARALRARAPRPSAILKEGRLKVLKTSCFNVFLMFYNVFFLIVFYVCCLKCLWCLYVFFTSVLRSSKVWKFWGHKVCFLMLRWCLKSLSFSYEGFAKW